MAVSFTRRPWLYPISDYNKTVGLIKSSTSLIAETMFTAEIRPLHRTAVTVALTFRARFRDDLLRFRMVVVKIG